MGKAFLYGNGGGGGGAGGTLAVTAPAGVTVKVSKDGKTYTKTANADGHAVFKGLASGTWTVTITDGVQTATRTAEVVADYAISLTFFAATINVTYPVGSVCTCSDGVTTLTAPDTSGTWACVVPNAGTWTVTANGRSEQAAITADAEVVDVDLTKTYLFKDGNQYTYRTGGWTSDNYYYYGPSYQMKPATIEKTIYAYCTSSPSNQASFAGTAQKIDLAECNTIFVEVEEIIGSTPCLCVATGYNMYQTKDVVSSIKLSVGVNSLDVSGLNSSYYVAVGGASGSSNPTVSLTAEKIWME